MPEDFSVLEKHLPQYIPPQFDAEVQQLMEITSRFPTGNQCRNLIRKKLQSAFMEGVITALRERAREQGVKLEP